MAKKVVVRKRQAVKPVVSSHKQKKVTKSEEKTQTDKTFSLDFASKPEETVAPVDLMQKQVSQPFLKNQPVPASSNKAQPEDASEKINITDLKQMSTMPSGSNDPNSIRSNSYKEGVRTLKDVLSPDGIKVIDDRTLKVGDKYVHSYVLQQYPSRVYVGWLDNLYSYNGNLDTMIYVEQQSSYEASKEITTNITKLQAQLQHDREKGIITNETKLTQEIARLENERAQIEMNTNSFYKVEIFANLFADSEEDLKKAASKLDTAMKGNRMVLMPTALRMLDGFRSTLPTMVPYYEDKFRNLNTGAVSACFPFYNAEICHPGGVMIGTNFTTGTPMSLNMYDKRIVNNTNMSVFGRAGSGKTYFTSLLIMRSCLQNIHTAIIDPEGEYGQIAKAMGGVNIRIAPGSNSCINVFDVEEAREVDDDGNLTGESFVDVKGKVSDLVSLFGVMARGEITQEQLSLVSVVLQQLYANYGITRDPASLYENGSEYDPTTGILHSTKKRKRMPTLSDFWNLLVKMIQENPAEYGGLQSFANQMRMFKRDGTYGLFDCESTVRAEDFASYPVINFDVHSLEEDVLRPIGMYVALTYTWEKIVKKNFSIRKRVVCDEAWMLMKKSMAGSEYTRRFLETCSRRIRKRNAGLLVASQNFIEFANCDEGKTVLSNTAVRIFLKQSNTDIEAVQSEFKLSDGEMSFLRTADTGQFLIKTDTETAIGYSHATPYEHELLTTKNAVMKG